MSEPIKLPPIPEHVQILFRDDMRTYARLAVEQNTEALRAECDALRAALEEIKGLALTFSEANSSVVLILDVMGIVSAALKEVKK